MKILSEQDIREKFSQTLDTKRKKSVSKESLESDSKKELKNYCLKLLVRRDYSVQELFHKAKAKGLDIEVFPEVINELQLDNYQSDQRFCEAFVNGRIQKQMGPVKIKMELKQKGVDEALISEVFATVEVDWFALALEVCSKKHKPLTESADYHDRQKAKAKLVRFLQSRGFESEQLNFALKELSL